MIINHDIKQNLFRTCRICLCLCLDEVNSLLESTYSQKYKELFRIEVNDDKFPTNICGECSNQLNTTYEFMKKCKSSNRILKKIMSDKPSAMKNAWDHTYCTISSVQYTEVKEKSSVRKKIPSNSSLDGSCTEPVGNSKLASKAFINQLKRNLKVATSKILNEFASEEKNEFNSDYKTDEITIEQNEEFNLDHKTAEIAIENNGTVSDQKNGGIKIESEGVKIECEGIKIESKESILIKSEMDNIRTSSSDIANSNPKIYKCEFCEEKFFLKKLLRLHLLVHSPFECNDCSLSFNNYDNFQQHTDRAHNKYKKHYHCDICNEEFPSFYAKYTHKRKHTHPVSPAQCTDCGAIFTSKAKLDIHMIVHNKKIDGDKQSSSVTKNNKDISTDRTSYLCHFCGSVFLKRYRFNVHMKRHLGIKPFTCEYCSKGFITRSNLMYHIRTHNGVKPYKCEFCGKSYTQRASLRSHVSIHTGEKPFKCHLCPKMYGTKTRLSQHLKMHAKEKSYRCLHCGDAFKSRPLRRIHIQTEHKITMKSTELKKPFLCDICGKTLKTYRSARTHRRMHEGIRPFKCQYCDKSFIESSSLRVHSVVHTGEKLYECEICCKRFSQLINLKTHTLVHTGLKPFKCEICHKVFRQKSSLNDHLRVHKGEIRFICDVCEKGFYYKNKLIKHIQQSHLNELEDSC